MDAVKIFIAYARKDAEFLDALREHMAPLIRSGRVRVWFDGLIEPGTVWGDAIKENLHQADIILLLVSAHSLSSDYFYGQEVSDAMKRHEAGVARVIPLILRSCLWQETALEALQALPKDGIPVEKWTPRDDAYENALQYIQGLVKQIEKERAQAIHVEEEVVLKQSPKVQAQEETADPESPAVLLTKATAGAPTPRVYADAAPEMAVAPSPALNFWPLSWMPRQYRRPALVPGILLGISYSLLLLWGSVDFSLSGEFFVALQIAVHVVFIVRALGIYRRDAARRKIALREAIQVAAYSGLIALVLELLILLPLGLYLGDNNTLITPVKALIWISVGFVNSLATGYVASFFYKI